MINLLNVDKLVRERRFKGPITSPQTFQGKSFSFHPQGLQSEELFGLDGSPDRRQAMSWVDLNCKLIHPVIFDLIQKRLDRKIIKMLSGEKTYNIGEDGQLVEAEEEEGELDGFTSFVQNINRIRYREDDDDASERNKLIDVVYKSIKNGTFFIPKLIIVSPVYRPVHILKEKGEVREDELNDIYRRVIIISHQIGSVSGSLYDILCYRLQLKLVDLYEYIRSKVSSKHGLIRSSMLGKRVDYSARAVIAPNPELSIGEVGIPLRNICQIFEPFMVFGLINAPEAKSIPDEFHEEVKKFLGKELGEDIEALT